MREAFQCLTFAWSGVIKISGDHFFVKKNSFKRNIYNRPPFRMEYRHLSKMRGTKTLLWRWNISIFQPLMDCLIYNNMKSCNKQWNTLPQLWNLLISIFHMEFHGTFPGQKVSCMEFHGTLKVPWNLMPTPYSMEFHGIQWNRQTKNKSCMEFHGILKVPWNLATYSNSMEFHGITITSREVPWNSMEI